MRHASDAADVIAWLTGSASHFTAICHRSCRWFSADTLVSFVVGLSESDVTVATAEGSFILYSNTIRWPLLKKSMAVTVLCKPEILK